MADSLVGVPWAKILGIGLGMDRTMFELHQRASFAVANEFGLPFWSNKTRDYTCQSLPGNHKAYKFTDDTIWSAHSVGEGALALFLGKVPTGEALAMARKSFELYSTALADAYDFRDVSAIRDDGPRGTAGVRPYCNNSHYTRHLLGLHAIPLALSGQRYDATAQSMSFRPRREPLAPGVHDNSPSFRTNVRYGTERQCITLAVFHATGLWHRAGAAGAPDRTAGRSAVCPCASPVRLADSAYFADRWPLLRI
jgi:hypothetical protein